MLLPSALTCDSSNTQKYYHQPLYASPPLSPPPSTHSTITNIYSTCRALQSMLTPPPATTQLPSPPIAHAEAPPSTSPFKLRLRARPNRPEEPSTHLAPRKRIAKRAPPRGVNKRQRPIEDEGDDSSSEEEDVPVATAGPSTPKRLRLAPEVLPLGLDRSDFHELHLQNISQPQGQLHKPEQNVEREEGETEWSTEEDRILVELILEKLKLTKGDWQDCARSLGKDRYSVGRRWKSLMERGDVGLKKRRTRGKICGTWR